MTSQIKLCLKIVPKYADEYLILPNTKYFEDYYKN